MPNDHSTRWVSRRDLLRSGASLAAVSALGADPSPVLERIEDALTPPHQPAAKPNIVFLMMDNLGYGEPGCDGGGITRGAATPRIDKLPRKGRDSPTTTSRPSAHRAARPS